MDVGEVSYTAVALASLAMFVVGMVWYGPIFGKLWGKMHGFDKLSEAEQAKLRSKMTPFYVMQLVVTVISAYVLAKLVTMLPSYSIYKLALLVWLGFSFPAQVSAVFFGGTKPEWMTKKILVMVVGSLLTLLAAAAVIGAIQK